MTIKAEAFARAGEIARFHVNGSAKRIALAREIAVALLEAEVRGMDRVLYVPFPHNNVAVEREHIWNEAQQLKKTNEHKD